MNKKEKYRIVLKQCEALLEDESHLLSDLANVAALLKETFDFFWVGFYLANENGNLYLGPFQGPVACTNIELGKGVCGTAAETLETIVVPNVHEFPGHIACSAASQSEIVVPLINQDKCELVLDVDSDGLDDFDEDDKKGLEKIILLLKNKHFG